MLIFSGHFWLFFGLVLSGHFFPAGFFLAVLDPNPAVSERLPGEIQLASLGMAGRGLPWSGDGRPPPAMALVDFWFVFFVVFGRSWPVLVSFGRCWPTMAWPTLPNTL